MHIACLAGAHAHAEKAPVSVNDVLIITMNSLFPPRVWSFITCRRGGGGRGGRPFCWGAIFQLLIVLGGSFSEKEALPGGHFMKSGIKKYFTVIIL